MKEIISKSQRLGSLDGAFLSADAELARLYKACCQAFENFDGLVDAFGVDDPMASVAAAQIESLLRAYETRLKTIRDTQSARTDTRSIRTPLSAANMHNDVPHVICGDVTAPLPAVKGTARTAPQSDNTDMILWAAFSWWHSWKEWQHALWNKTHGRDHPRLCSAFNPCLRLA